MCIGLVYFRYVSQLPHCILCRLSQHYHTVERLVRQIYSKKEHFANISVMGFCSKFLKSQNSREILQKWADITPLENISGMSTEAGCTSAGDVVFDGYNEEQIKLMEELCIILDNNDLPIGAGTKMMCHLMSNINEGLLHRAFSVFLFNENGKLLLQQRADEKITFPSMWTNTCCSHPLCVPSELGIKDNCADKNKLETAVAGTKIAAQRKLFHELGLSKNECPLSDFQFLTRIHYKSASGDESSRWGEHEIDYILILRARSSITIDPSSNEVKDFKFVDADELKAMFKENCQQFTPWFKLISLRHFTASIVWRTIKQNQNLRSSVYHPSKLRPVMYFGREPFVRFTRSIKSLASFKLAGKKKRNSIGLTDKLTKGPSFNDFVSGRASQMTLDPSEISPEDPFQRLPKWLKVPIPKGQSFNTVKKDVRELKLSTVCEEAKCPNIGECWGGKKSEATATIMLLGDTCTRGCRFCSVKTNRFPPKPNPMEPQNTAEAILRWGLGYVVLTTVDRDDLVDGGARHLAETVQRIKAKAPHILVEVLGGDFRGDLDSCQILASSGLDVYAHNLETVEKLTPHVRDRRASYRQSLSILEKAKVTNPHLVTKTSLMLGFGETDKQILDTLTDLRNINCDVVTFGQYMRPTKRHMKVVKYVQPEKFDYWKQKALEMGFLYVASGPLVRSSYKAGEAYIENVLRKRKHDVD